MRTSFYRPTEKETRATTRGRQPLYIAEDIIDDGARSLGGSMQRRAHSLQGFMTERDSCSSSRLFIAMNSILHCKDFLLSFMCGV